MPLTNVVAARSLSLISHYRLVFTENKCTRQGQGVELFRSMAEKSCLILFCSAFEEAVDYIDTLFRVVPCRRVTKSSKTGQ